MATSHRLVRLPRDCTPCKPRQAILDWPQNAMDPDELERWRELVDLNRNHRAFKANQNQRASRSKTRRRKQSRYLRRSVERQRPSLLKPPAAPPPRPLPYREPPVPPPPPRPTPPRPPPFRNAIRERMGTLRSPRAYYSRDPNEHIEKMKNEVHYLKKTMKEELNYLEHKDQCLNNSEHPKASHMMLDQLAKITELENKVAVLMERLH